MNCNSHRIRWSSVLSIVLLTLLQMDPVECNSPFPKLLWVFWDSGFEKAPVPVQLSLKNMKDKLKETRWQVRQLSNANLKDQISQQEEKQMVRNSSIDWMISDQLRLVLLIKYGGVYMDSSCFLLQDFTWLENINTNPDVVNRFGQYPTVLLFHTTYQSSFQYRKYQKTLYLESPGVESWFIAATPNSVFLKLWLNELRIFMIRGKEYIQQQLSSKNIHIGTLASDPTNKNHYFSIYEAFHSVLQKRQHQIDNQLQKRTANLNNMKEGANLILPLAVQQFGLWFIPAVKGPFKMMLKDNINFQKKGIQALTEFTQDQLREKYGEYKYLIKITGSMRKKISKILENPSNVTFLQHWNFTGNYACLNTYYIAKNSIFDKYLLSYMSPEQRSKINIVDKKQLPFLCQQSDIQYLTLGVEAILIVPLAIFIVLYATKLIIFKIKAKSKDLLTSAHNNEIIEEKNQQSGMLNQKQTKIFKPLQILKKIPTIEFSIYTIITTIFLGSMILQLIGWCWQLLSNLVSLLPIQFLVLGWLIYSTKISFKNNSSKSKLLSRGVTLLILVLYRYIVSKYNLAFDDNLNEDTNNFYLYGVTIGITIISTVYWWIITTFTIIEKMSKITPSKAIFEDSNMQPAQTQNVELNDLIHEN